jgi:hypothetical protein
MSEHENPSGATPPPASERYELGEIFTGEEPENLHFLQVVGQVILVALLALAAIYVLTLL